MEKKVFIQCGAQYEDGSTVRYDISFLDYGSWLIEFKQNGGCFVTIEQLLGTMMLVPDIYEKLKECWNEKPRNFKFIEKEKGFPVSFTGRNGQKECCSAVIIEEHYNDNNQKVVHIPCETAVIIVDAESAYNHIVYSIKPMDIRRVAELIRFLGIEYKENVEGLKRLKMQKDGNATEIV